MPRRKTAARPTPPAHHPLEVIRRAVDAGITDCIVYFSGGKDSAACYDLCRSHFPGRVEAAFMYFVPNLSFQETYLRYIERRYSLSILRLPHWALSRLFRDCSFRHGTQTSTATKLVRIRDVDAYVRRHFGIDWIATGEKVNDSLERRTQIVQCDAIHATRRRIYPVAWWTHFDVMSYLDRQQILPSPEYRVTLDKKSFGSLWARQLVGIRDAYPDDWEKIKRQFPLIEAQVQRWEQMQGREGRESASEAVEESESSVASVEGTSTDG